MMNAARYWSALTLDTMREDFSGAGGPEITGPGRTSRVFAMVHAAFHDSYVSGVGSGRRYRFECTPHVQPSPILGQLSGARSAHQVLRSFYTKQKDALDQQ